MATVDELVVRIRADAGQLERELKRVQGVTQQTATRMSTSLSGLRNQFSSLVPALSVAAVVSFGRSAFIAADQINDLSQRIGIAGTTLSALNIPLLQSGSSLEEFSGSIVRMNNALGEAAKGNQSAISAFDAIGLSVTNLRTLSPEDQFFEIARALNDIKDQATFTETGINIFGRSFATLAPLIRQSQGNLRDFTNEAKKAGTALTQEQLDKIDQFGDKWVEAVEKIKITMANAMPALSLYLDGILGIVNLPENAFKAGRELGNALKGAPSRVSSVRPNTVNEATFGSNARAQIDAELRARGLPGLKSSAAGSNTQLLKETTKEVKELANQQNALATAQDAVGESAVINARLIKDSFGDALESVAFDFKNFGAAASSILNGLARNIARKSFLDPLSNAAGGFFDSFLQSGSISQSLGFATTGGYGPFPGFADGGSPPVGRPSIVGERGPEIFVPNSAGTIIPNHALGGQSVVVNNTWQIGSGVTRNELASLIPMIEARTEARVFAAIEQGGRASQIVGKRS